MVFRPSTRFPRLQLIHLYLSSGLGSIVCTVDPLVSLLGHGMRVSLVVSRMHFASVPSFSTHFDVFALICFNASALVSVRSHLYLLVHTHPRRSLTSTGSSGGQKEP